ncbi:MAG: S24 family peptidase [Rubrivivax sp.]
MKADPAIEDCSGAEPFALQVLGDSMAPEFADGDIIVCEPEGLARDGSYVVAWAGGEWTFRQLRGREGQWRLHALDPSIADVAIDSLNAVRGVVIQKSVPGRRRLARRYA